MLLSGLIIFYRRDVLMEDWSPLVFFSVCLILCYVAARPKANTYNIYLKISVPYSRSALHKESLTGYCKPHSYEQSYSENYGV